MYNDLLSNTLGTADETGKRLISISVLYLEMGGTRDQVEHLHWNQAHSGMQLDMPKNAVLIITNIHLLLYLTLTSTHAPTQANPRPLHHYTSHPFTWPVIPVIRAIFLELPSVGDAAILVLELLHFKEDIVSTCGLFTFA